MLIRGTSVVAGTATGELLLLDEPLSLWGGVDIQSSRIVDDTHPQRGLAIAGRILAMPSARGSSSSSSALVELARSHSSPAAILLRKLDPILVIGSLVAEELYGACIPILIPTQTEWQQLRTGQKVRILA